MTQEQMAMLATAIEASTRPQFKTLIASFTEEPSEQIVIMGGVIGLMLREMHRELGDVWLEALLKTVLQPPAVIAPK